MEKVLHQMKWQLWYRCSGPAAALRVLAQDAVAPAEVVAAGEAGAADAAGEAGLDHDPVSDGDAARPRAQLLDDAGQIAAEPVGVLEL